MIQADLAADSIIAWRVFRKEFFNSLSQEKKRPES